MQSYYDWLMLYELQQLATAAVNVALTIGIIGSLYWLFIHRPRAVKQQLEQERIQQDLIKEHIDRERQWMERNEALLETLAERLERIAELLDEERSKTT